MHIRCEHCSSTIAGMMNVYDYVCKMSHDGMNIDVSDDVTVRRDFVSSAMLPSHLSSCSPAEYGWIDAYLRVL